MLTIRRFVTAALIYACLPHPVALAGGPDLAVLKSDGDVLAVPGNVLVYTLDAAYVAGVPDLEDLVLHETIPEHTIFEGALSDPRWNCLGTLPGLPCVLDAGPGPLAAPVAFAVLVDDPAPPGVTEILNTATLSTGSDPDTANNTVTISTPFAGPDLAIGKDDGGITAFQGEPIVYTLTATYVAGSPNAQDLLFTETVPEHTTFDAVLSDGAWNCLGVGAGSTCVYNAGPGPLSGPVTFAVIVDNPVPDGTTEIVNTASLGTNPNTDPNLANNVVTISTPLTVPVELMTFTVD